MGDESSRRGESLAKTFNLGTRVRCSKSRKESLYNWCLVNEGETGQTWVQGVWRGQIMWSFINQGKQLGFYWWKT